MSRPKTLFRYFELLVEKREPNSRRDVLTVGWLISLVVSSG